MAGRFAITEILGAGAFAVVCGAADRATGDEVALKLLRVGLRREAGAAGRLRDEGRILGLLEHPNLAHCREVLDFGGQPVLVFDRVRGWSLDEVIREGPLSCVAGVALGHGLARALLHGWESVGPGGEPLRIVHRDLKPANVLIEATGRVVLIDYGIAKGVFEGRRAKSLFLVQGTAGYDAPERASGGDDDDRVDVYGLGALLLTAMTSFSPVLPRGADRAERLERHLSRVDGPTAYIDLLREMLAAVPAGRPRMSEVVVRLEALGPDPGTLRRPDPVPLASGDSLRAHALWSEVAFLEQEEPTVAGALPADEGERELRRVLHAPDWSGRAGAIEAIFERCPELSIAPLVEVLERSSPPWYTPWIRPSSPAEIAAALLLLCDRATPSVVSMARGLVDHEDDSVRASARFLLAQHTRS